MTHGLPVRACLLLRTTVALAPRACAVSAGRARRRRKAGGDRGTILTPEQKAAAALKRAATRKARHTLGPKAKLKVRGASAQVGANGTQAPQGAPAVIPAGNTAPAQAPTNQVAAAPAPAPAATAGTQATPKA